MRRLMTVTKSGLILRVRRFIFFLSDLRPHLFPAAAIRRTWHLSSNKRRWSLRQPRGGTLRYPETQTNESGESVQSGNDNPVLTPEGRGPIAEYEFAGTGFYVGDGYVVTNRHVAQPWLADERAQSLNSKVSGQPRLKKFMAFFPDHPQPVALKFKQAGQRE